jgi:hypothetical protein
MRGEIGERERGCGGEERERVSENGNPNLKNSYL